MNKIKRPMYYETDEASDLDEYYLARLENLNTRLYVLGEQEYKMLRDNICGEYIHDQKILKYRQIHLTKFKIYISSLEKKSEKLVQGNTSKIEDTVNDSFDLSIVPAKTEEELVVEEVE